LVSATGNVRRQSQWSHGHLPPHEWMSIPQTQQTAPAGLSHRNSRQPISTSPPTHAPSSVIAYERSLTVVLGP
ncbi:hypothetical protein K443DRAFT_100444, partial [Laccaria amethystina LaAM-08-1]